MNGEIEMSAQVVLTGGPPVNAPTVSATQDPPPAAKATGEISEGAKRTQKIIEAMDLRRQERVRLVAALKSRVVEVERAESEGLKAMEAKIAGLKASLDKEVGEIQVRYLRDVDLWRYDLFLRDQAIEKLDVALFNFRKQLEAELDKLDPERKGEA